MEQGWVWRKISPIHMYSKLTTLFKCLLEHWSAYLSRYCKQWKSSMETSAS